MDLGLKGKVVVITGGATGIGKAAALEFAREGCQVCVCGRRKEKIEEAQKEFQAQGFSLYGKSLDITDEEAFRKFAEEIEETFGHIDIWLNNAGMNYYKMIEDMTTEEFREYLESDLVTVFTGSQIALRHMKKTGGGVIMNASSFTSLAPIAGKAAYSLCKAAVNNLTLSMAGEFAPYGIRVLAYIPGMIKTDISADDLEKQRDLFLRDIPARRFGTPEDLAKSIVFHASDCAAYINGVTFEITGAKRCVQNCEYPWQVAGKL